MNLSNQQEQKQHNIDKFNYVQPQTGNMKLLLFMMFMFNEVYD